MLRLEVRPQPSARWGYASPLLALAITVVIGVILFVFFVLLVTDILGFTKVFPFTRSIR